MSGCGGLHPVLQPVEGSQILREGTSPDHPMFKRPLCDSAFIILYNVSDIKELQLKKMSCYIENMPLIVTERR